MHTARTRLPTTGARETTTIARGSRRKRSSCLPMRSTTETSVWIVLSLRIHQVRWAVLHAAFGRFAGSYSRLIVTFIFDRESGFYMLQIFLPSGLVVVISWVSFWINRDSAPSRFIIFFWHFLMFHFFLFQDNHRRDDYFDRVSQIFVWI